MTASLLKRFCRTSRTLPIISHPIQQSVTCHSICRAACNLELAARHSSEHGSFPESLAAKPPFGNRPKPVAQRCLATAERRRTRGHDRSEEIGRASCRERECPYV